MGYFIKKQNRKNITRFFTVLSLCFLLSGTAPLTALAHDAEWGMWRGEQNALIIGTITETEGNLYQITVNHALTCGPEGAEKNVIDRMLPLSEIPGELTADFTGYQGELYSYTTSYHGRGKPEKGDFVLLSLDKKEEIWKLVWPPYELSGTDPQTLELLPEKEKTNTAAAWEIFIRSGGSINDFFFSGANSLSANILQEDGSVKRELLWERQEGTESETADKSTSGRNISDETAALAGAGDSSGAADGRNRLIRETGEGSYRSSFWPLIAVSVVVCILCFGLGVIWEIHRKKNRK